MVVRELGTRLELSAVVEMQWVQDAAAQWHAAAGSDGGEFVVAELQCE